MQDQIWLVNVPRFQQEHRKELLKTQSLNGLTDISSTDLEVADTEYESWPIIDHSSKN